MYTEITIFNTLHFDIEVEGVIFKSFQDTIIKVETSSFFFRLIRAQKGLKVMHNAFTLERYKRKYTLENPYDFNMVYDAPGGRVHKHSYKNVIESFSNPIISFLPEGSAGFSVFPSSGVNLRFFSSLRVQQQNKVRIGPNDVFMSHGIGDKNYWIAERIAGYKHAFVPGPAWANRIMNDGYKGRVWQVGYPKLDPIFNGKFRRNEYSKPYVVWAPTHSYTKQYKGRTTFPACIELIKEIPDDYITQLALHPANRLASGKSQDVTLQELIDADVVIADSGSTIYEAWALGKPVVFLDWLCKNDVLGKYKHTPENLEYRIYAEGIGYHAKNMNHFLDLIQAAASEGISEREVEFIENIFPVCLRGNSGRKAAEALMEIRG